MNFKPELSVITYTIRVGGLDWMMRYLSQQTFSSFEWIVVDGLYDERKEHLAALARELGVHLIHVPEPSLPYNISSYNISSNGNKALELVSSDKIVVIDDWHIFPKHLLETHMFFLDKGIASIPAWHHVRTLEPTGLEYEDYERFVSDIVVPSVYEPDPRLAQLRMIPEYKDESSHFTMYKASANWWWPNATAATKRHMIDATNGYDERLNGGTGGTDSDLANRMEMAGLKFVYLPNLNVYHITTTHLRTRKLTECKFSHDRHHFFTGPYPKEYGSMKCYVEDGIRYYDCSECGSHSCLESQDVIFENIRKREIMAPEYAGGWKRSHVLRNRNLQIPNHQSNCLYCKGT